MVKANYHTHTERCKHARGSEREYIESAIEHGFEVLGFSDHTPQPYENGFVSRIRMDMSEFDGYMDTIRSLKEEYSDRIEIKTGLEAGICFIDQYGCSLMGHIGLHKGSL